MLLFNAHLFGDTSNRRIQDNPAVGRLFNGIASNLL